MTGFEASSIAVAGLTALITLGGVLFVGLQVRQAARSTRDATAARQVEWHQRRRESSMHFYIATLDKRDMYKGVLPADRDTKGISQLIADAEHDNTKLATMRTYLNYFEMLATGVNVGVLDEDTVYSLAGSRLVAVWNNYRPWIIRERDKFQVPSLSIELEHLAERMSVRCGIPIGGGQPDSISYTA